MIFVNELGNTICMSIVHNENGITVVASGPTSMIEHTWTPLEAKMLRDMLNEVVDYHD